MAHKIFTCIKCGARTKDHWSLGDGADMVCCIKCYIDCRVEKSIDAILNRKCDELRITEGLDLDGLG